MYTIGRVWPGKRVRPLWRYIARFLNARPHVLWLLCRASPRINALEAYRRPHLLRWVSVPVLDLCALYKALDVACNSHLLYVSWPYLLAAIMNLLPSQFFVWICNRKWWSFLRWVPDVPCCPGVLLFSFNSCTKPHPRLSTATCPLPKCKTAAVFRSS
jgi:hypothetical protein